MSSEFDALDDPAGPGTRERSAKSRLTRSKIAKPLLTSLGTATMLAASTFVLLAVSSTGSARPWDWTRADPAAALGRYQACGNQGLGAIGCMLGAGFRPASAAPAAGSVPKTQQPLFSIATVQDSPASQASGTATRSSGTARSSSTVRHSSTGSGWTGSEAAGSQHLAKLPANATTADVLAACQAAIKTAQAQGAAAMNEVEVECADDLASRCTAMRTPPTPGPAAIQEMEDACWASTQRPPSQGAPSPYPDE